MTVERADALPSPALMPECVYTLPELRYPRRLNVAEHLLDANAEGGRAGRPAVVTAGGVLTYGELARRVNRLCHGLSDLGLEPGDRVLLRLPNVPEFVIAWLACQKLGVVTVGTMPMLRARASSRTSPRIPAPAPPSCGVGSATSWSAPASRRRA
jgi:2-aminobenzoate-CoA ligase